MCKSVQLLDRQIDMRTAVYVIIPVYNNVKLLANAVNSVLEQPYSNIKVIIVDDGSTDGSSVICDELSKIDRVKVIHQTNKGVSVARNKGIRYVLSVCNDNDYIAFCDSDDFWNKNIVDKSLFENECDILGFGTYCSNYSGNKCIIGARYENELKKLDFGTTDWIFKGTFAAHLYKAVLFRNYNLGFPEKVKYNEDIIFLREVFFCAKSFFMSEKVLYIYRSNPSSAVHNNKISPDNALHIPMAWFDAKEIINNLDINDNLKEKWKKTCEDCVAARLLENARQLAINGYTYEIIESIINKNEISYCLNQVDIDVLADWQKDDLIFFRDNIKSFVAYYNKYGKKYRVIEKISSISLVKKIYNLKKYRIKLR